MDSAIATYRALPIHQSVLLLMPASVLVLVALSLVLLTNSIAVNEATHRSQPSLPRTASARAYARTASSATTVLGLPYVALV